MLQTASKECQSIASCKRESLEKGQVEYIGGIVMPGESFYGIDRLERGNAEAGLVQIPVS